MRNLYTRSEATLILIGTLLIAVSVLIQTIISKIEERQSQITDPFPAEYVTSSRSLAKTFLPPKEELKLPTAGLGEIISYQAPQHLEEDTQKTAPPPDTSTRTVNKERLRTFLLAPGSQQILHQEHLVKWEVQFHFEAFPKGQQATFELYRQNHLVHSEPVVAQGGGVQVLKLRLEKTGVYQWRITPEPGKGDFRSFTLIP